MKSTHAILVILIILIIDQWSKFYIKTHFALHESVAVFSWFKIYFIENEGMAWGAKIPGNYGKLILTVFRLLAIVGIGYWLYDVIRKQSSWVLTLSISMIFAGAMGNIIDSVFYAVFFEHSMGQVAQFLPPGGGCGKWVHGKVGELVCFSVF